MFNGRAQQLPISIINSHQYALMNSPNSCVVNLYSPHPHRCKHTHTHTQAVALWINFMGFTDGREPLIFYILASWGLPIIIVVITILIWQFGVDRPLTELYGQRNTGEM